MGLQRVLLELTLDNQSQISKWQVGVQTWWYSHFASEWNSEILETSIGGTLECLTFGRNDCKGWRSCHI